MFKPFVLIQCPHFMDKEVGSEGRSFLLKVTQQVSCRASVLTQVSWPCLFPLLSICWL